MLAEQESSAGTAAEDAASRLLAAEQAAAQDRENLQEQIGLLEQKLSEATAIQEDLATRLQVRIAFYNAHSCLASMELGAKVGFCSLTGSSLEGGLLMFSKCVSSNRSFAIYACRRVTASGTKLLRTSRAPLRRWLPCSSSFLSSAQMCCSLSRQSTVQCWPR